MSRNKKHVDYYQVLGVSRDATDEDIKKGYRKQALRWHPDKNHGDVENAAEQFKIVSEAYQVLSDRRRRQIYDLKGCNVGEAGAFTEEDAAAAAAAFDLNAFSSPADIYRQFFPEDAGFADLLDSLDYGKRKTRRYDVNGSNAGDAGTFAYGGTAAGAYDFDTFLSPADLYRKFFPEDKAFADYLDSFGQNGPQQAGNDRTMNSSASTDSDGPRQPGNDQYRNYSNSSDRDRQQQTGNDQRRKYSTRTDKATPVDSRKGKPNSWIKIYLWRWRWCIVAFALSIVTPCICKFILLWFLRTAIFRLASLCMKKLVEKLTCALKSNTSSCL